MFIYIVPEQLAQGAYVTGGRQAKVLNQLSYLDETSDRIAMYIR